MGMAAGDLYITLRVKPHAVFQRNGDDIEIRVPVTVTEAGLAAGQRPPLADGAKAVSPRTPGQSRCAVCP